MSNLIEIIEKYFDKRTNVIREYNGRVLLGTTKFLPWYDESVVIGISYIGDSEFVIDDCHSLTDYYDVFDIDVEKIRKKFDELTLKYQMKFDGKILWKTVIAVEEIDIINAINTFIDELFFFANLENI